MDLTFCVARRKHEKAFLFFASGKSRKALVASWNDLKTLPSLQGNSDLEVLTVRWNELEKLPPLDGLRRLAMLELDGNNLTELPNLDANTALELLDVSGNQLKCPGQHLWPLLLGSP